MVFQETPKEMFVNKLCESTELLNRAMMNKISIRAIETVIENHS